MSVTVLGLSGLTNAYMSVPSICGSAETSGASRRLDAPAGGGARPEIRPSPSATVVAAATRAVRSRLPMDGKGTPPVEMERSVRTSRRRPVRRNPGADCDAPPPLLRRRRLRWSSRRSQPPPGRIDVRGEICGNSRDELLEGGGSAPRQGRPVGAPEAPEHHGDAGREADCEERHDVVPRSDAGPDGDDRGSSGDPKGAHRPVTKLRPAPH